MNKTKFNTEQELEFLRQASDMVRAKAFSLRAATDWLEVQTGVRISYEGLRRKMKLMGPEGTIQEEDNGRERSEHREPDRGSNDPSGRGEIPTEQ